MTARLLSVFLSALPAGGLMAAGDATAEVKEKPEALTASAMRVLKDHCLACHNTAKKKGGLDLSSRAALLAGGETGPAVMEGKPEASPLLISLKAEADPHMPPKKQLPDAEMQVLRDWVELGSPWDAQALALGSGKSGDAGLRPVSLSVLPAAYRPVMALALSPDGSQLAAGFGAEVLLFETTPDGLTLRARDQAHLDPVQSLAWAPDGRRLITGAFRRAVVWQTGKNQLAQQREIVTGLSDRITSIVVLPGTGQALLADGGAGEPGIVREVDPATGLAGRSWTAHEDTIYAMTLSGDGRRLATAGGDRMVKLWDPATGQETARMEAHSSQVLSVAFTPDHARLATGGADRQIKVWDTATRENLISLPAKSSAFNALVWQTGGPALVAAAEDGTVLKYTDFKSHSGAQSSETGKEERIGSAPGPLYSLTTGAGGGWIFAGTRTGRILAWSQDGKSSVNLELSGLVPVPAPAPAPAAEPSPAANP